MVYKEYIIFVVLLFKNAAGDPCYEAMLMGMSSCPDFKNEYISTDGITMQMSENGKSMTMSGFLEIMDEINDEFEMSLSIVKELENGGTQQMFSTVLPVCTAIEDEKAAWHNLCQSMNMTTCPVSPGKFYINDITVEIDCADTVMNHDNCGDYIVQLDIACGPTKICACIVLGLTILEEDCDDE